MSFRRQVRLDFYRFLESILRFVEVAYVAKNNPKVVPGFGVGFVLLNNALDQSESFIISALSESLNC